MYVYELFGSEKKKSVVSFLVVSCDLVLRLFSEAEKRAAPPQKKKPILKSCDRS